MVELSYETSHSASNDSNDGRAMLYRSKIDPDGAEISHLYHFQCCYTTPRSYPCFSQKLVPFDKIAVNPSDLKHVGKLLGCTDGLGMVILAR